MEFIIFGANLLVGIILWLGWAFHSLSVSLVLLHYSLFKGLRRTKCWHTWMDSSYHPSVSTVVHLGSSHTQAISPTALLSRFSFFSTYPHTASSSRWFRDFPRTSYWRIRLKPPKVNNIIRYSESDLLLFDFLPPI